SLQPGHRWLSCLLRNELWKLHPACRRFGNGHIGHGRKCSCGKYLLLCRSRVQGGGGEHSVKRGDKFGTCVNTNTNSDSNSYAYPHPYPDSYAHTNSHSHSDAYSDSYAHT